jgi:glycosyltransferase involved in cell wall biosynthesis
VYGDSIYMKICLINNLYPPYARGGAEQVVKKTIEGLIEKGHDVVLITTSPKGKECIKEGKLTIYRFQPRNLFFYTEAHKHNIFSRLLWHMQDIAHTGAGEYVKEILEKEKPDVVHTHNLMGVGFVIPRVIRSLKLPHIHTVHDVQLVEPSGIILKQKEKNLRYHGPHVALYTALMKRLMGSPDVVVSPSQFLLNFYESRGFFPKSKRVMVRNPITFEVEAEVEKGEGSGVFQFLYLGQIEQHKGVDFLVHAVDELLDTNSVQLKLQVVGGGSLLEHIKSSVKNKDKIVFSGKVDRANIPDLLKQTDVTIIPSLCYENSPTVFFESLAFSTPVLASDIEGIAELVEEGVNGITFNAGDSDSLKEKILWCVEHQNEIKEMAKETRVSLLRLNQKEYINDMINLYQVGKVSENI